MARRAKNGNGNGRSHRKPTTRRRDGLEVQPHATELEMQERRELVTALVMSGAQRGAVERACREKLGLTSAQVRVVHAQVVAEIKQDFEERRASLKALQWARLQNLISRLYAQARPPVNQIAKLENIVAKLTGTYEPLRHRVDVGGVSDAFAAVVAGLTEEDMRSMMDEQLELERAAGRLVETVGVPAE